MCELRRSVISDKSDKIVASIFIHVDDGYLSCENDKIFEEFKTEITKIFTHGISWTEGNVHEYLGMVLDFSESLPSTSLLKFEENFQFFWYPQRP